MHLNTKILKIRKPTKRRPKTRNPIKERSMSFVCCTYKDQEEDDFEVFLSPPSRKTRRNTFSWRRSKELDTKNPYSNRGLDKFEALLADLDDKKRKIFTQKGSQYISLVRFVYKNSNDMKPKIVWLKDPRKHDKDHYKQKHIQYNKSSSLPSVQTSNSLDQELHGDIINGAKIVHKEAHHAKPPSSHDQWKLNLKRKLKEWWMPSYNLPLFVIFVMLFLTIFGRSFAIICTSIAWYVIPNVDGTIEKTTAPPKKFMIKNHHSRKPSENKVIASPKPFFSGPINVVKEDNKMKKLMSF